MATKKKAAKIPETSAPKPSPIQSELLLLDPSEILVGDNVRYALKPYKVEALAADIMADALKGGPGVHNPIEVELLSPEVAAQNLGAKYQLVTGEYRLTAVDKCNDQGAGLKIPAFCLTFATPLDRLDRQVKENTERENMSYIDIAGAIDRYLMLGMPRVQIRDRFPRLNAKGKTIAPASNAWINKVRRFLEFPKKIQQLIHDGVVGYQVAVNMLELDKDKWDDIITSIMAAREKAEEKENKDDERLLNKEAKEAKAIEREQKAKEKAEKIAADLAAASELVKTSAPAVQEKLKAVKSASDIAAAAYKAKQTAKGEAKTKATEELTAANKALASAKAEAETANKVHKANEAKLLRAKELDAAAKKLEEEKKNPPAPLAPATPPAPTPISQRELNKAAAETGANTTVKAKPFKAADMMFVATSIRKLSDPNTQKKTFALGQLLMDCFDGKLGTAEDGVDAQVQMAVAKLLGEGKK